MCVFVCMHMMFNMVFVDLRKHDFTPRLFELSSITQEFLATEVLHPCRSSDGMAFPFTQSDLYHASQPGVSVFVFKYL